MNERSRLRGFLRWSARVLAALALLVAVLLLVVFRGALYNRFVAFPREAAAWESLRAQRREVVLPYHIPWNRYQGAAHNHSHLSHDSEVPFEHILQVLKDVDYDFIAMSDHCLEGGIADFGAQWKGLYDGKLFIPGFEKSRGLMSWRLPPEVVLDCGKGSAELAREIESLGGLLFIAHPEQPREWDIPEIKGMEIYNIHADVEDESLASLLPDIILNFRAYRDQTFRLIFDRNTKILEHWDQLNRTRDITGIAANDSHQSTGVYGVYTTDGNLEVRIASGEELLAYRLNPFTRLLLRMLPGPLEPGREVFRIQLDPYELMTRYVATHVFASDLTEEAILDAFEKGRAYIGFDMIVDSSGFTFLARAGNRQAIMGERIPMTEGLRLVAASPVPCRFTLLRHGAPVHQEEGTVFTYTPTEPGKYRVEAEVDIRGEWTPWVYTNPINVTEAEPGAS